MAQNPKPALVDRSRTPAKGQNISPTERSVHVTFASTKNQSIESSMASVIPTLKVLKPGTPTQDNSKNSGKPHTSNNTKASTGEHEHSAKAKTMSTNYRSGNKVVKSQSPGPSGPSNRVSHPKSTKSPKSTALSAESPVANLPKEKSMESVNSLGSLPKRSKESSSSQDRSIKTKKNLRKLAKLSSKSFKGILKRSKSGKKLKAKPSSTSPKNQENDGLGAPKPQLDSEYVSELSKIAQILHQVSVFDAATSTDNDNVSAGSSPRVKITSVLENNGSPSNGSIQRPLSTGELKQLLSSITRLVSLHQLTENDHGKHEGGTFSGYENSSSTSLKKATKKASSTKTTVVSGKIV